MLLRQGVSITTKSSRCLLKDLLHLLTFGLPNFERFQIETQNRFSAIFVSQPPRAYYEK